MTEREIFETFMRWMGMKEEVVKIVDDKLVVKYEDTHLNDERFTKEGYDEFYCGAVFDEEGKIVRAYIDSHVAYASNNCREINKLLSK